MARRGGPALRVRSAAEESLRSEQGWPAAPELAATTEKGNEGSEFWGAKVREGGVELREGRNARAARVCG
jgi:hypothetical protein